MKNEERGIKKFKSSEMEKKKVWYWFILLLIYGLIDLILIPLTGFFVFPIPTGVRKVENKQGQNKQEQIEEVKKENKKIRWKLPVAFIIAFYTFILAAALSEDLVLAILLTAIVIVILALLFGKFSNTKQKMEK